MSEKTSKYAALLRNRKEGAGAPPAEADSAKKTSDKPTPPASAEAGVPAEPRRRGRPKSNGKRLNPAYTQVTAYIPAELHSETKINLIRTGKREFSVLIEELLISWNRKQGAST